MAFESLSEKFQNIFRNLRAKGSLTEADVKTAMREVKLALLEADVNFKVVKQFVGTVTERAVGEDVMHGLNPGQMVIKIVNEEMTRLMGSEVKGLTLNPGNEMTVILLCGLQGAGKTTMAAKLAGMLVRMGKRPLLAALDVYRPAAIRQLEINGEKVGVPVFQMGDRNAPADIAKAAVEHAKNQNQNVLILDTAGRLHVDGDMMAELNAIKRAVTVHATILVLDAMTGQDAVNVASAFHQDVGVDGAILTKLDGDTRGGAALSIRAVTGVPIYYTGVGEKLTDIEPFYPDRMASRILGMGDVLTLIEKAAKQVDMEDARDMEQRLRKGRFDYNDYLKQMEQVKNMGGIGAILGALPAFGGGKKNKPDMPDEDEAEMALSNVEAMIRSMTPYERSHPDALDISRKRRIARGSGMTVDEVNRMVKQFEQSRKMMKQMSGMMSGKKGRFKLPFGL
ncbi:MAG: signal recognition particle protein [Lachnospiraceae bacterium]|nr:signal recognition particle protein [Lachnospiraceae bacterium]